MQLNVPKAYGQATAMTRPIDSRPRNQNYIFMAFFVASGHWGVAIRNSGFHYYKNLEFFESTLRLWSSALKPDVILVE